MAPTALRNRIPRTSVITFAQQIFWLIRMCRTSSQERILDTYGSHPFIEVVYGRNVAVLGLSYEEFKAWVDSPNRPC
jgi:hypothetical protein